jgi:chromosome segregation ATPase
LEVELSNARMNRRRSIESGPDIEERLRASEAARDDQTVELARMLRNVAERNLALARIEAARDELERRLERARAAEGELRAQLQGLSAERAAAQGALMMEQGTRRYLQDEIDSLRARLEETIASSETLTKGDAALRLAIAKIGRDLLRARAPQDEELHVAGQIVNFARREPTG